MYWAKRLIISLFSIILLILLLNGACALGERLAYGAFWGKESPEGLYIHKNGERLRLKANVELNGWLYQVSVNSLGFRGMDLEVPKPTGSFRVWCMGGSTTFDIFSDSDANTWPAQTEAMLSEQFPNQKIEVLNAGIPGDVLLDSRENFLKYKKELKIDAVVIYHGPNDLSQLLSAPQQQNAHQANQIEIADNASPFDFILEREDIASVRVLRKMLTESIPNQPEWESNQMTQKQLNEMQNRLEQTIRLVKKHHATPILATHALKAKDGDTGSLAKERVGETTSLLRMTPERSIETIHYYNQMVKALALKYHIPVADIRSVVGPEDDNWGNGTHFKPKGSELAAQEMARAIAELID